MQGKKGFRLLLTGGDTGGHLYPALAVAEALAEMIPGSESIYVGASGRVDMEKAIGTKITTLSLGMPPFDRERPLKNITLPIKFVRSFFKADHFIQRYRPHAVMGVGAFPSVPVVMAAWVKKIPILLLEPNAQPGMANSLLAKVARRICVSQPGMEAFFLPEKIVVTGTPVRKGLLKDAIERQLGCDAFGVARGNSTVLITGGSTGSVTLNNMVLENLDLLTGKIGHIIWQTGEREKQRVGECIQAMGRHLPENCTIVPYIGRMGLAYAAADLVVSSAGAVSLSELAIIGRPAVIIPDPDVTENHQLKNAKDLYEKDACMLMRSDASFRETATGITELINNHSTLKQLKNNISKHAEPQAARLIAHQILQIAVRGD